MMIEHVEYQESVIFDDKRGRNVQKNQKEIDEEEKGFEKFAALGIRKEESRLLTDSRRAQNYEDDKNINGFLNPGSYHYPSKYSVLGPSQVQYNYPVRGESIFRPNNEVQEKPVNKENYLNAISEENLEKILDQEFNPLRNSLNRASNSLMFGLENDKSVVKKAFLGGCLMNNKKYNYTTFISSIFDEEKNLLEHKSFLLKNKMDQRMVIEKSNLFSFIITPSGRLYIHNLDKILLFETDAKEQGFFLKKEIETMGDSTGAGSVLHLVFDEKNKQEYLIVCGGNNRKNKPMNCVIVYDLVANSFHEFITLNYSKGRPIIFHDQDYIYILGGCPEEPKYCDRIALKELFNFSGSEKIHVDSLKVRLLDTFITKKSFTNAAAIPTNKGFYLLGRKKEKALKVHSISNDKKVIYIKYAKNLKLNKKLDLCNGNVYAFDNTINYIYHDQSNPSPDSHEVGCIILDLV